MKQRKIIERIKLPEFLKQELANKNYTLDNIGMSDSQVLMFEDKVLKIQENSVESENEVLYIVG